MNGNLISRALANASRQGLLRQPDEKNSRTPDEP
jgi:hypothetical protein